MRTSRDSYGEHAQTALGPDVYRALTCVARCPVSRLAAVGLAVQATAQSAANWRRPARGRANSVSMSREAATGLRRGGWAVSVPVSARHGPASKLEQHANRFREGGSGCRRARRRERRRAGFRCSRDTAGTNRRAALSQSKGERGPERGSKVSHRRKSATSQGQVVQGSHRREGIVSMMQLPVVVQRIMYPICSIPSERARRRRRTS
jgi:hypothetical protein